MIIALLGNSKSGKDEFCKEYINNGYKRYAFGDIMKEEFAKFKGCDINDVLYNKKEIYRQETIDFAEFFNSKNAFHWIDKIKNNILNDINNGYNIIITDVRRISHLVFFKVLKELYGGQLYHLKRPLSNGGVFDEDKETALAISYAEFHNLIDKVIINDKDAYNLQVKALEEIKKYGSR